MTHPQKSLAARRARHKEQLRRAARGGPSDDPQLHRMLASHIHCAQVMQLVTACPVLPDEGLAEKKDVGLLTYRCSCGFSFDQRQD
jgi:hypothetical protein